MQSLPFADAVFLGNPLTRWLVALGIALVVLVGMRIVAAVVSKRVRAIAERTATDIDDLVAELLDKTKFLFVLIVAVWAGSLSLSLSLLAQNRVGSLLILGLLLQAGFWGTGIVNYVIARYRKRIEDEDPGVATTMGAVGLLARVLVWSILLLMALDTLGIDITALLAGVGVGGIAVAFAIQGILGDLFASISILLDKPFVVGDFIVVGEVQGSVEHVGLKTTHLRSISGEQIVIGNSDLLASRIRNYGRMAERRASFQVGVVYGTPSEKLKRVPEMIREAIERQQDTRFDRCHFKSYGDSALIYDTVFYMVVPDYTSLLDTQQAVNLELYERFEREGIEFAFPTQTLFLNVEEPLGATTAGASS